MEQEKGSVEDLVNQKRFWQDKKVFLTGHSGFKGNWLSLWLNLLGAKVTGFSLDMDANSLLASSDISRQINCVMGDIRNLSLFSEVLSSFQPEIIFHLAAQSLVRFSYADPITTFSTNVMGTVNLLEAVRKIDSVKAVVVVTSDKCYENSDLVWGYREQDPMGGHDPYSASKGCTELAVSAYRRSFFWENGAAIATVRAGNVIGGGDWSNDRIVPDIIRAVSRGKTVAVRNPTAVRPWQHVCEPLYGYLILAEHLFTNRNEYAEAWNFGPDDEGARTVSWLADYVCSKWGERAGWHHDKAEHPHEANYLKLDCSKAKARLGWHPRLDLATALDWTVEWYKVFFNKSDVRELTAQQIVRYLEFGKKE